MLVLALAAACRGESGEPVRLGVVVGNDGVRGVEMALADANAAGGLGGRHLTIRVIPHQFATAAEPSILAADSLAADLSVVAVIGHSNSAASLAASQVYNARRLAHVAPTSTAPMLTRAGDYTFRLVPDDRRR